MVNERPDVSTSGLFYWTSQFASYIHVNQKLKHMDQPMTKTEKTILTIIGIIVGLALLSSMMSCSAQKTLYKVGEKWKQAAQKSEVTGWARTLK